ncbi:MAG: ABC-F family ATP-binding cassette domain-containing protein [Bacteroidales bacterium]|nr:ABC-F family ATP-binding cassette domain-containing protein [Bacteroidales bacterium]
MLSVENITVSFGGFDLFKDVSFLVNKNDKIGLVGRNGAGKSTLMKMFAGLQRPAEGRVVVPGGVTVGYLPQQMVHKGNNTVIDEVKGAFKEVLAIEAQTHKINTEINERTDYESKEYFALLDKLAELNDRHQLLGGFNIEEDIEKTLLGLGFMPKDFNRKLTEFSGGWRMRVELAKILLKQPSAFLLDEPTNHLDIESIQWLEEYLQVYDGALVLISHDRAFLDNVTNRTIELSLGKAYDYKVPYSKYVELSKERRATQLAAYRNQQKMIEDTEQFIERFRYKATKAVQVQSRIKQLDKIERIEVEEENNASMNIKFAPAPRSGKIVLEAKELDKAYGNHQVLDKIDLVVERGERVAFVGKNGEGKTTLSKIIVGELDYAGKFQLGYNVSLGYFAQNQDELLDENITVLETIDRVAVGDIRTKIRDILGAFLFSGEDVDKKVKVLSGGERSRLAMAKLLLQPYNLLILDEPTNHLDMHSKDLLKIALQKYDGTLIVVSHDREFLDGLVEKVYEFRNKKIKENLGGIYDFLKKKKIDSLRELERKTKDLVTKVDEHGVKESKLNYEQKKEFDRNLRKISNQVTKSEQRISGLEAEIEKMKVLMADTEKIADQPEIFKSYERLNAELENEMQKWEHLSFELEEFMKTKN